ncbi:hypothetical protein [Micromonospora sp. WMMC273]|uniref:hypothetical protein n=1 Tax=Micromonospora sp. WMMC273 TaxID=3015157 RepID=UPI0022B745DF|nr:hypothetical protein [Micromonospora sp. WMMC273]MCZ7478891.1 hypothetical protein [Micromonospora sp. WMMC273]
MTIGIDTDRAISLRCYAGSPCSQPSTHVVLWNPPGQQYATTACEAHTERHMALVKNHQPYTIPVVDGTFTVLADHSGTQVANCRHCGHHIYLYPRLVDRDNRWRSGEYDETGRCPDGERRNGTVVHHEPATTVAERDRALGRTFCGRRLPHALTDCFVAPTARRIGTPDRALTAITWALAQNLPPYPKLLLVLVARHADPEGVYTRDVRHMQTGAGLNNAQVLRSLKILNARGLLLPDALGDEVCYRLPVEAYTA